MPFFTLLWSGIFHLEEELDSDTVGDAENTA
jgi:hypothetical protein